MTEKMWRTQAASNIALIKYMGKKDSQQNIPNNVSFSYTSPDFYSVVELRVSPQATHDVWLPLQQSDLTDTELSLPDQQKFINHLAKIKQSFDTDSIYFTIKSGNNFPSQCGIASSASSFAALTECAVNALQEITRKSLPFTRLVSLTRSGSGSACRSLLGPWVKWLDQTIEVIDLPYPKLIHQVVIVDQSRKRISSSQAHRLITTSHLYAERDIRAQIRYDTLLTALSEKSWRQAYEICWHEFADMHALFHTANPHFSYLHPDSIEIQQYIDKLWEQQGDGPLLTMDAGPNIHLLYRLDQHDMANHIYQQLQSRWLFLPKQVEQKPC